MNIQWMLTNPAFAVLPVFLKTILCSSYRRVTIRFTPLFLQRRREECERKARRGEMDPRLEFTFQLLIDATGLSRHEIMDHVFEGEMVSCHSECNPA